MLARAFPLALVLGVAFAIALPMASAAAAPQRSVYSQEDSWSAESAPADGGEATERGGERAVDDAPEKPASAESAPAQAPAPVAASAPAPALDETLAVEETLVVVREALPFAFARNVLPLDDAHPIRLASPLGAVRVAPVPDASPHARPFTAPAREAASQAPSDGPPAEEPASADEPRPAEPRAERPASPVARALATPEARAAAASAAVALPALAAFALYSRMKGADVLESEPRKRLLAALDGAGLGVDAAAKLTGLAYGTAQYHLDKLVECGYAVRETHTGRVLYFKNGGSFNADEREAIALLANAETLRVLSDVLANPGTYRAAVADRLGVTPTTVSWHLKRLVAHRLVREEKNGRRQLLAVDGARLASLAGVAEKLRAIAPGRAAPVAFEVVGVRAVGA